MINCNPATVLYLLRLPLRHVHCAPTDTRKHARTQLLEMAQYAILPRNHIGSCRNPLLYVFVLSWKRKRTKKERKSTIKCKHPQCREEMWTFLSVCADYPLSPPLFQNSVRSRLLCWSVTAQGTSCFGHMKLISPSQRGPSVRGFIGAEVTKTWRLLAFKLHTLTDQLHRLENGCVESRQ